MRRAALVGLLALSACGQREQPRQGGNLEAVDASEAPSISPSAAPGVAFAYAYSFRLADARIRGVQEIHAAACEKLGLARCRITGMRYSVGDAGRIDGMLSFALDPASARAFGNDAIAAVERNDGALADAEITGTDAGGVIAQADGQARDVRAELATLENRARTATGGEREALVRQAEALRAQLSTTTATRAEARASLAMTPMTFNYRSGSLVGGFDVRDAVGTAFSSFNAMLWFVVVMLPWALLAGLVWAGFRFVRRRFAPRRKPVVHVEPASAPMA